jgi:hypothetical protein
VMPGAVLHQGAMVQCTHAGNATPSTVIARVTVSGQSVVVRTGPWTIAGCTLPPPNAGNGPCVTATFSTAATRVTVMGQPLLLRNSTATCVPTSTPLQIRTTQTRVEAT